MSPVARRLLAAAAISLAASAVAFAVILPFRTGQVGYDSAASVIYFDRIAAGQGLEAFITATPKPLLTLVFGALHAVTGDWRTLSWATIAVYGLAVALAAELGYRLGRLPTAAFAAVALIGSRSLLLDASLAYAVSWAVAGWLAAALALTGRVPHWRLAGIVLLAAGLARIETMIIVAPAAVVLAGLAVAGRWRPNLPAPPREAWATVLIPMAAIPVQLLHDWLLTGNALWSFSVPVAGSVGAPIVGPLGAIGMIGRHVAAAAPMAALALIGLVVAIRRRAWVPVIGLLAMGPGIAAFVILLGLVGLYVSDRYLTPVDIAIVLAAAIGSSALRVPELTSVLRSERGAACAALAAAAVAAAALSTPFGPLDRVTFATIRSNLALHRGADSVKPTLAAILDGVPGARDRPLARDPSARSPGDALLVVPALLRPELAVDLDLSLDRITEGLGRDVRDDGSFPRPGQIVYHDRRGDQPPEAFTFLEVDQPTRVGAIGLVPLEVDPARGIWIVRVEPGG